MLWRSKNSYDDDVPDFRPDSNPIELINRIDLVPQLNLYAEKQGALS
jgi:hypothetical protein